MGDRGIMIMGGTPDLHGDRSNSWTKLTATAPAGSASIEVLNAGGWRKGDIIVVASTDFDPHQAERRAIAGIGGNTISLDSKLDYMHYGKISFGQGPAQPLLDARSPGAKVPGLLTFTDPFLIG
jgi:cell migration-inducing and hyaluronan-binding protein